jgi:hypothetical protein
VCVCVCVCVRARACALDNVNTGVAERPSPTMRSPEANSTILSTGLRKQMIDCHDLVSAWPGTERPAEVDKPERCLA